MLRLEITRGTKQTMIKYQMLSINTDQKFLGIVSLMNTDSSR